MMRVMNRRGFTLLELLVVISIVGLVAGVVVASFSGGIRVWESASILTRVEQEAYFSAEYIRRDIASTFEFHDLGFKGDAVTLHFPGLVPVVDKEGETRFHIGTIRYLYNQAERALYRLAWPYPYSEDDADSELIAGGIDSLRLYYLEPGEAVDDDWLEAWQQTTNFPAAVRIEISISGGGQKLTVDREIPLMESLWRAK